MLIISIASSIAAFVCKKIYFLVGKANPNSYIGDRLFAPIDRWPDKSQGFLSNIIRLSMAYFFTDMAAARYITFIPIAGTVILIRNIEWIVSEPSATYESNGYIILVYDKCLSDTLGKKKNAIEDGVVTYNEIGVF